MRCRRVYRASKCPCGDPICQAWHVDPVASIRGVKFTERQAWHVDPVASIQGVKFTERQARIVADLLNAIEPRKDPA
jgi:hypothetical protein